MITVRRLIWKDKYNTPRCSLVPIITLFGKRFRIKHDLWWEQYLWIHYYCDGDYDKAKESWPWKDAKTEASSWVDYPGLEIKIYKLLI